MAAILQYSCRTGGKRRRMESGLKGRQAAAESGSLPGAVRRQSDFKQFHRGIDVNSSSEKINVVP
jgi:hypothetical protein